MVFIMEKIVMVFIMEKIVMVCHELRFICRSENCAAGLFLWQHFGILTLISDQRKYKYKYKYK